MQFKNKPNVAVFMVTYNHADYIAQAIEGVIMQQTDFPVKLFIGEDCSTDDTREVCLRYKEKYPDKIELILHEKNIGGYSNAQSVYRFCFAYGDYTAMCEGDDYWTDPHKLQKQVDFLEANREFAICFHNVQIIYEDNKQEPQLTNVGTPTILDFEDLASKNYISTVSCVFRNQGTNVPIWYKDMAAADYPLHLLNAQHGKIRYFDEVMAVYRIHAGGVWSMINVIERYLKLITVVETCRNHFAPRGKNAFTQQLANYYKELCFAYFSEGKYAEFQEYYIKCLKNSKYLGVRTFSALTVRYLLTYMPFIAVRYHASREAKRKTNLAA